MPTIQEMIKVMQAADQGQPIEMMKKGCRTSEWYLVGNPAWDWSNRLYRVKEAKPSIDWDCIDPKFKYMVCLNDMDLDIHSVMFAVNEPFYDAHTNCWMPSGGSTFCVSANIFASFKRGNLPSEKSLIKRS